MGEEIFKLGGHVLNPKMPNWGIGKITEANGDGNLVVIFENSGQEVMKSSFLTSCPAPKLSKTPSPFGRKDQVAQDDSPLAALRSDPNAIGEILEQITSSRQNLEFLMSQLLESVGYAHAISPSAWSTTFFQEGTGFRVNVGPVEVFVYQRYQILLNFLGARGVSPFMGRYFYPATYASIPGEKCKYEGLIENFLPMRDSLKRAHRSFVELAATRPSGGPRSGTPYINSHSEGLVRFAQMLCDGEA